MQNEAGYRAACGRVYAAVQGWARTHKAGEMQWHRYDSRVAVLACVDEVAMIFAANATAIALCQHVCIAEPEATWMMLVCSMEEVYGARWHAAPPISKGKAS